jgi:RecB family exonuclease
MTADAMPTAPEPAFGGPLPGYESHSSLSTYESCPLRYAYRYVERRPGEIRLGQFAFANAIHRAFELFVRERVRARAGGCTPPGIDILWTGFDEAMVGSGLPAEEVERARLRAVPVLARFVQRESANDAQPVGAEMGFGVPVELPGETAGIRFVGYVDRVDRRPDGSTEVIDYKTGRVASQADVDADRQLTAYAFACARGGLRDPASGKALGPASRLGLYFTDRGTLLWTTRNPDQLEAFEGHVVETVQRVRRREFAPRPDPAKCWWCEYRTGCPDAVTGS